MSDRDARDTLANHLQAGGVVEVVAAVGDGPQAVGEAGRLGQGAVIIDGALTKRLGAEFIQEIKAVNPKCRVLVLAASESARKKALEAGADQVILKPSGAKKLAFGIGVALSRLPRTLEGTPRRAFERIPWAQGLALAGMGGLILLLTPYSGVQALGDRLAVVSLATGGLFFLYALKYYASVALILLTNPAKGNGNGNGHSNGNGNGKINGINGLSNPNGQRQKSEYQPFISIHLPVYNEPAVIDRLVSACTSFDYDRYEVIVADDSQDETSRILDQRWAAHPRVKISRRKARVGFKGAALQLALQRTDPRAEFIAVFDADFIPPPDILQQFLTYFYGTNGHESRSSKEPPRLVDDRLAAVQGYQWHVLNASENWITRGIRTEYSGSYVIERSSQQVVGSMRMIAGSVFMIRADVMRQLGWGTSITEDWDLTLRLYETGYKVVYTPFVQAPAECVASLRQLARQRMRWAEGHTYNIKKHLTSVLLSPHISWPEKLEFLYFAPYYLQSALFIIGTLSWLVVDLFLRKRFPFWPTALGWSLVFTNALSLVIMNLVGLFMERGVRRNWGGLMSFILLTYLLVPFQAYAALKGLFETHEGGWHRTQKTGVITDVIEKLGLRRKMRTLLPKKTKKKDGIDIGQRLGMPVAKLVGRLPRPVRQAARHSSLGFRLASGLLLGVILLSVISGHVPLVSAAPDAFYLHDASLNGGRMMDNSTGTSGATLTFDTPSQSAAWYTDLVYPTGSDDGGIAAGAYTVNLYFNQLPTLPSDWYSSGWLYRKKITIDHTKVAANQSDFPIVLSLASDSDLASKAQNSPTGGYDILFTSSNGTTKLSHEIERFNDSTGELVAWVEIPSISASADTDLYMYYGNASIGNQQDSAGTWSNGFVEVWHLDETSGNLGDSTSNGYTGTASGSLDRNATGQIDGADEFLGPSTTTYLTLQDGDLSANDPFSISAWFSVDTSTAWAGMVTKGRETGNDWIGLWANGTQYSFGWDWQAGKGGNLDGSTLSLDTWYYGVATFDGTNRRLYLNNALDAGPSAGFYDGLTGSDTRLGNDGTPPTPNSFDGFIDEVRFSSSVRALSWIQTEYNNQGSPSTFFLPLGSEQRQPSVDITVNVSHTAPGGGGATTIVSTPVTIYSTTANPLALSLGSGAAQTFTTADPRRLMVLVNVDSVSSSGSFVLAYDSSGQATNLSTPAVSAPDNTLVLLLVATLIPVLTAAVTSGRRLGLRLGFTAAAMLVALSLLARQVGLVSAAPDSFYLHDTTSGEVTFEEVKSGGDGKDLIPPDGDVAVTNWTEVGGNSVHFDELDETTDDGDTTYTQTSSASGGNGDDLQVSLTNLPDPLSSVYHLVEYRWRNAGDSAGNAAIAFTAELLQGAAVIASQSHSAASVTSQLTYTTSTFTLTQAEADSITDYNDLRIRFNVTTKSAGSSGSRILRVTWAAFTVNWPLSISTSANLTAVPNNLYLAAISTKNASSVVQSISGLGLTWSFVDRQCGGRHQTMVEVWSALGTPTGDGVVTANFDVAEHNAVISVSRYSGVNVAAPIGAVSSSNSVGVNGACSGGTDALSGSVNLTTTAANSYAYGAFALRSRDMTGGTGYQVRNETYFGAGGDVAGVGSEDKLVATASTVAVDASFNTALDWAVVAVEIKAGGASPVGRTMNTVVGSGAATFNFGTPGQSAYWYTDIGYPTGADDASIAAGNYTLNTYFDSLPTPTMPQVSATNTSVNNTAGTQHTVSLPTGVQSGDLLIVVFGYKNGTSQTINWPGGWTQFFRSDRTTTVGVVAAYRQADGSEGSTITVGTSGSIKTSHNSYRITGAENPLKPPPQSSAPNGTSPPPAPPSLTPTGGAKDYLWIAVETHNQTSSQIPITGFPASYSAGIQANGDISNSTTASPHPQLNP